MARAIRAALGAVALGLAASAVLGGPLVPPAGPAGSTGKTLRQVEPRVGIASLPVVLDRPGSYYLEGDLEGQEGVTILVAGVTLDLNGFTLRGAPGSGTPGIAVASGVTRTTIKNGVIESWAGDGVEAPLADNGTILGVTATGNGGDGFDLGSGWIVSGSSATLNSGSGIGGSNNGVASDFVASDNQETGIRLGDGSTVSGSSASGNSAAGIVVGDGSVVVGSSALGNGQAGVAMGDGSVAQASVATGNRLGFLAGAFGLIDGCGAHANAEVGFFLGREGQLIGSRATRQVEGVGVLLGDGSVAVGNLLSSNATGLEMAAAGARAQGNTLINNSKGLVMRGARNLAVGNFATGNGTDFDFEAGNSWGTVLSVRGDGAFGVSDTFANLRY